VIEPVIMIAVLAAVWFLFLRTRATPIESPAEFESLIVGGQPVVVDFFSNT